MPSGAFEGLIWLAWHLSIVRLCDFRCVRLLRRAGQQWGEVLRDFTMRTQAVSAQLDTWVGEMQAARVAQTHYSWAAYLQVDPTTLSFC
jgi:hypothetical protein